MSHSVQFVTAPETVAALQRTQLLWFAAGITLLSGCLLAVALIFLRSQALDTGQRLTRSFAQVIEEQTSRSFQSVDQTLELTADKLDKMRLAGTLTEESARQLLLQELKSMPFGRALWVADAKGRLIYDAGVGSVDFDASQTPYLKALRAEPKKGFLISLPVKSKTDSQWLIPAARALIAVDGSLLGTIAATINPLYFETLWKTIDLGDSGSVALIKDSGKLMMRAPFDGPSMSRDFANEEFFQKILPGTVVGDFTTESPIDGVSRMFSYRALSAQPDLVVTVGQSYARVLQPWRDLALLAVVVWAFAAAGIFLLCLFLSRAWSQKIAAQAQTVQLAERLRLATDAAEIGVWDWDIDRADQWFASPTYFTMLGYEPEEGFANRSLWIERLHPEDRPDIERRIQAVLAGDDVPYQYETRIRHANGTYRWISVAGRVLQRDKDGKATRLMGIRLDITDRKLTEERLRLSEENLSITLQSIGDAVIATDATGRITRMNLAAERLTGWSLNQASGRPLQEVFHIIHTQTREPAVNPVQQVMEKGDVVGLANHTALVARDGTEYQIFDSAAPIRDRHGVIVGVVLVFSDVTEQYRVREELAHTVRMLERTGEMAKVGGWEVDLRTMQLIWSRQTSRLHDVDPSFKPTIEEAVGFCIPEARPMVEAAIQAAITEGTPWDFEVPMVTATGRRIWTRVQGYVELEHEQPRHLMGAVQDITEYRQARLAMEQNEARYRALFEYAPDGILILDARGYYVDANARVCHMLGYTREEIVGVHSSHMVHPSEVDRIQPALDTILQHVDYHQDWLFLRKDGSVIPTDVIATLMPDGTAMALIRDVTERRQAENALRESAAHTETILNNMVEAVITINAQGLIESFNKAASEVFGYTPEEIIGRSAWAVLAEPDQSDPHYLPGQFNTISVGSTSLSREAKVWRKDGTLFPIHLSMSVMSRGGQDTLIAIARDITQQRHDEDEIRRLAFYDPLTGLPNRRLLMDRLKQAMTTSTRTGKHGALMFLDLDHFKLLNDTQGHDVGDLLLRQVAVRLQACVRDGDSVARLGGDEFVILLEGLSPQANAAATQAELVATKLLDAFRMSFSLHDHRYDSTPSIGIVVFMGDLDAMDDLLKKADLAMYQSKAVGRNTARFFDPKMQAAVQAHDAQEKDLRRGLSMGEFVLHYQVQVQVGGQAVGAEALVRWNHPERGLVTPVHFIALAEETGLILPLGQWVLETACAQLVAWASQPAKADWTLAVNVSASQFAQSDFVANVAYALHRTGAKPHLLKLELTESILVHDVEDVIEKMAAIKAFGVGFSLDDFGTGYSSLSYLKRLPLDQLKIDQSFVRDVLTDPSDAVIARTIVALGHSLGLTVIAEGVETEGQHAFLADAGCDAFQGYFFGRPSPAEALHHLLSN